MITNVDEIKAAISMEELLRVLGHQLNRQHRTTCPVHGGNDANFSVKEDVGTCWSQCGGKTWDVIELVRDVKNMTFPEALEWIAEQSGVAPQYAGNENRTEIVERARQERARKDELYGINEKALQIYEGKRDISLTERYAFDGRDWSGETVKAFRLCQAPNENKLAKLAQQGKLSQEMLQELGLIKHSQEKDVWYDFLRNRILFPFFTHQGQVAGFSGRKLSDAHKEAAKYKNSQESLIYHKREILFGLWQSRRHIQEADSAIMMEGMADVVTAYDYGIRNVVATGGTAITTQQLRLVKRFTHNLTILMDGDEAGEKAAASGVEEAISVGLRVKVVFFDEPKEADREAGILRYDPDNFLRRYGADAFRSVLDQAQDGMIWRVMQEWHPQDAHRQSAAVTLAARLISLLDNEMLRDYYVRELTKSDYLGKTYKKHLEEAIKDELEQRLRDANKPTLSSQQQSDIRKYGLYIKGNQYWVSGNEEVEGYPISNFIVRPVMLVVGSALSERRVEIVNIYGAKFTANINSDSFVEMSNFRKEVERRGNYLFLETFRLEHFTKIKRKLYDEMKVCYPIKTLGRHLKQDFFAWANGLVVSGRFQPIDEHGIVTYNDTRFYLEAFAAISDDILSDDQDNSYEDQKNFIMVNDIKAPDFESWTKKMKAVHGEKGMMAVAWYLAALYRDIIYGQFEYFPHLNCFGPPGTGKSFLGWSLSYMFGKARRPYNLHDGTNVGFFRRMAQVRNGVAWYDEYNNNIHPNRAQGLKNAYDGAGREKGVASTDNRTVTTAVNSALLITGQEMPTQDIALYTRCITMNFPETQRSEEQIQRANELAAIQNTGCLSQITSELQQYRGLIEKEFNAMFDEVRQMLSKLVAGREVHDRLINNYAIPLTAAQVLSRVLTFGFNLNDLTEYAYRNLIWQSESISQEDDLAKWWDVIAYYVDKGELLHNEDILVQMLATITVRDPQGKATDTHSLDWEEERKVLFLTFTKSYRFYREQLRREGDNSSLNKEAVRYYLKASPAFLGEVRAKKFNGKSKSCYAFDMSKLKFDLILSAHVETDDTGGQY